MIDSFKQKVQLTRGDIRHGVPQECSKCPIARRLATALAARFRRWERIKVSVDGSDADIRFTDGSGHRGKLRAELPQVAQDFINDFDGCPRVRRGKKLVIDVDAYGTPAPVKFELEFQPVD